MIDRKTSRVLGDYIKRAIECMYGYEPECEDSLAYGYAHDHARAESDVTGAELVTIAPNSRQNTIRYTFNVQNKTLRPFSKEYLEVLEAALRNTPPLDILRAELDPEFYAMGLYQIQIAVIIHVLPSSAQDWIGADWESLGCAKGVYNTLGQGNK